MWIPDTLIHQECSGASLSIGMCRGDRGEGGEIRDGGSRGESLGARLTENPAGGTNEYVSAPHLRILKRGPSLCSRHSMEPC